MQNLKYLKYLKYFKILPPIFAPSIISMQRSVFTHSFALAILACLLWSTAFAGIKIGLQYTQPLQFAGIRFMISGLLILPFTRGITSEFIKLKKNWKPVLKISIFQTLILYSFFYLGIERTSAAVGAIVVGAGPLFVALLAHFITGKDPMTTRKIIALLIGFSGIVLLALAKDKAAGNQSRMLIGILLLVTGNIAGSFGNILVSRNKTGLSPVFLAAVQIFFGGFMILIVSLFFEEFDMGIKPLQYYISLGWLSIISAGAFTLWFIVLSRKEVKVSEINVWKFMIPLLGAGFSWLMIAGEKPEWYTVAGMILTAASILIIFFRGIYGRLSGNRS